MSLKALQILTLSAMLGGAVFGADSRLADAVQRDDKVAVRSLVADRANINVAQSDGTTALHWAVRHNDLTTADLLIKAGADVKAANRYGLTPIQLAATNGNPAMIERLLAAGADPNFANSGGETVLMTASRTGNLDAIFLLLARGANVNAKESERGQTALMWAVLENHADAVKLLVARGADINAKTTARTIKGEYTPARTAGAAGPGIIRQRALPTAEGGMTALLFAVRDGNAPMTRLLLDSGADIQLASANDTSPLIIAILNGQTEIASYLLNRGANPNAIDAYKRGPLFAAIELRNFNHEKYSDLPTDGRDPLDLIKALLAKGANPNQQTNTTPVHGLMQFDGSGEFRWAHVVYLRSAFGRCRGDEAPAPVLSRCENHNGRRNHNADGRRGDQLDSRADLHAFRGRIRRGCEFVPRAGRRCERRELDGSNGDARRGQPRLGIDCSDSRGPWFEARSQRQRRPNADDLRARNFPRHQAAGTQAEGDGAAE